MKCCIFCDIVLGTSAHRHRPTQRVLFCERHLPYECVLYGQPQLFAHPKRLAHASVSS